MQDWMSKKNSLARQVKGKPKTSKQENRNLRKAMHLPSLSAVKYNENLKDLYVRLVSRSGIKMKALIAVQRRLLQLIYIVHKTKKVFNQNYEKEKRAQLKTADTLLETSL